MSDYRYIVVYQDTPEDDSYAFRRRARARINPATGGISSDGGIPRAVLEQIRTLGPSGRFGEYFWTLDTE